LKPIFFILSALGAGATPKALDGVDLPLVGTTCLGAVDSGADIHLGSAEGGTCPGVALANSNNGSTVIEGTSFPFTTSSLTLFFVCLGFGELALKIQEKGRNQSKSRNKSTHKFRKSSYLGVSSSSPPYEALAFCFWAATLGLFE
jgi:hypothetical protein